MQKQHPKNTEKIMPLFLSRGHRSQTAALKALLNALNKVGRKLAPDSINILAIDRAVREPKRSADDVTIEAEIALRN